MTIEAPKKRRKPVTFRDVAKHAGVSTGTVSRALSKPEKVAPETLERVKAAIKELRMVVNVTARTFKTQKSQTLLVMAGDIGNPFTGEVIRGAVLRANELGYSVILAEEGADNVEETIFGYFESRRIDGLAFLWGDSDVGEIYASLTETLDNPAVVGVRQGLTKPPCPHVTLDNEAAAYRIATQALGLGHRNVAIISSEPLTEHVAARVAGFKRALSEVGLDTVPSGHLTSELSADCARGVSSRILELTPAPTLILTSNDLLAAGILAGLRDHLIDSRSISVTGFDDLPLVDYLSPSLTTVHQPRHLIGYTAIDLLVRLIRGPSNVPRSIELDMPVVIRDSVSAPSSPLSVTG